MSRYGLGLYAFLLPLSVLAQSGDTSELVLSTTAEALTVRAYRIPHGELATTRISQLEIYLNPSAKADPLLAVNTLPAATNPDESANVSLRGSPAEATGIYLNGVPLRSAVRIDQSNGVGQFSLFRQVALSELRIYPSSPPMPFSQASAGAVAIQTGFQRPPSIQQGINLSVVGVGYNHARPVAKYGALRGYVNVTDLTLFQGLNGSKLADLRESRAIDGMLSFARRGEKGNGLQLFYLGFDESYRYNYRTDTSSESFDQRKPRHLGVGNYEWSTRDWTYRVNQLIDWQKPTFQWAGQQVIVAQTTTHTGLHAERRSPGLTLQYGGTINNYFDPGGHSYLADMYISVQRQEGHWLLGGGIKPVFDGQFALNAQAAARIQWDKHRLHFSGGDHTQLIGPGLVFNKWQRLRIQQLAVEHQFGVGDWKAESALFAKREHYGLRESIDVCGAEGQLTYSGSPWVASIAVTMIRSRGGIPTRRDIPLTARGALQYNFDGWSAGLTFRGRSGTVFNAVAMDDFDRYPYYRRLDASVSKTLITSFGALLIYMNANNLLDTKNVSYYSFRGEEYYSRRVLFFGAALSW